MGSPLSAIQRVPSIDAEEVFHRSSAFSSPSAPCETEHDQQLYNIFVSSEANLQIATSVVITTDQSPKYCPRVPGTWACMSVRLLSIKKFVAVNNIVLVGAVSQGISRISVEPQQLRNC